MAWSAALPHRIPVRSQVDLRPLEHALNSNSTVSLGHFLQHTRKHAERTGFLCLLVRVEKIPAAAALDMVAWRQASVKGTRVVAPSRLSAQNGFLGWVEDTFSWRTLEHEKKASRDADALEAVAPTAAFECALLAVAHAVKSGGTQNILDVRVRDGAELPSGVSCVEQWLTKPQWWLLAGRAVDHEHLGYVHQPPDTRQFPAAAPGRAVNLFLIPAS